METLPNEVELMKIQIGKLNQEIEKLNGEIHDQRKQTEKDLDLMKRINAALNEKTIQYNLLDKMYDQFQEKVLEKI